MNNILDLIPKNKFDISTIEKLKSIDPNEAEQILLGLMEWMQDLNWPVAQELKRILPRFHVQLIPVIKIIFKTDDDIWKYWTLKLLKSFPKETMLKLQPDLDRIANFPTDGEKIEHADKSAYEILGLLVNNNN